MDQIFERKCILFTFVFILPIMFPKRPDALNIEYPIPMYIDLLF